MEGRKKEDRGNEERRWRKRRQEILYIVRIVFI